MPVPKLNSPPTTDGDGRRPVCPTRSRRPVCPTRKAARQALVLLSAFWCQMISLGFAFSLGVFFLEFVDTFPVGRGAVSWATSLCSGILHAAGLLAGVCIHRAGPRVCTIVGGIIAAAGVLASSFVNNLTLLYFTFGVINGFGLCMVSLASFVAIGHHFKMGRAAATCFISIGAGIGSLSFPILHRFLIDYYHWRGALMVFSGIMFNIVPVGIFFAPVKPAIDKGRAGTNVSDPSKETNDNAHTAEGISTSHHTADRSIAPTEKLCHSSIWRNLLFVAHLAIVPIVSTGYTFPYVTLVDLGVLRGVDKVSSTWLLTYVSVASILSSVFIGILLKCCHKQSINIFTLSVLAMGVVLFVFPSLVTYNSMVGGAVGYGIAMGGITGTHAAVVVDIIGLDQYAVGLGFVLTGYGVGYLLGTPIAGWMHDLTGNYNTSFYIGGSLCIGSIFIFVLVQFILSACRRRNHALTGQKPNKF